MLINLSSTMDRIMNMLLADLPPQAECKYSIECMVARLRGHVSRADESITIEKISEITDALFLSDLINPSVRTKNMYASVRSKQGALIGGDFVFECTGPSPVFRMHGQIIGFVDIKSLIHILIVNLVTENEHMLTTVLSKLFD